MIVFLFLFSLFFAEGDSYSGLFIYIILPTIMFIGLLMIPIGIRIKRRKEKKGKVEREFKFPVVDFNDPKQRLMLFFIAIGLAIFLLISALGSYQAFHYTESNEFCGTMCHDVMEPEYVTYHNSAHARVKCVECHVGTGTSWYVKSKLSGLYQVYSVLTKAYAQPIETPVHNLRPAQETCEKCHWPQQFYDPKFVTKKHYLSDDENTQWNIQLLMKTGPSHQALGQSEGIHWHINPDVKIEYKSSNRKRDTIIEVVYKNSRTGESRVYKDHALDGNFNEANIEHRTMDCLDCHNRPSHNYKSPSHFVDDYITAGMISLKIPEIKSISMGILVRDFPDLDSAMRYIPARIEKYYTRNYEEFYHANKPLFENAIQAIQEGYRNNIFPYMKAQWKAYPNYLGHIESNGCYRCHNNTFKSDDGHVISKDCSLCHSIKAQGPADAMDYANADSSLYFNHPFEMTDWEEMTCYECHQELF